MWSQTEFESQFVHLYVCGLGQVTLTSFSLSTKMGGSVGGGRGE